MPVEQSNWAARIQNAKESKSKFEPVPLERFNFVIEDEPEVKQGAKGDYIAYRAKIMPGQKRANALVFERTFPFASNPGFFLELFNSMGYDESWLLTGEGPSAEQIGKALMGRPFSAEVYVPDEENTDKNGDAFRGLKQFRPVSAVATETAQPEPQLQTQPAAPAAPAQPQAPAAPAWGQGATQTAPPAPTPDQTGGSPWNSLTAPPANPFAPQG